MMRMTEKRYTTVELPKPNNWGIWYDGNYLSTYEVCHLLNEYVDAKKENEQLKSRINELEIINEAQSDAIDGLQETICHFNLEEIIK